MRLCAWYGQESKIIDRCHKERKNIRVYKRLITVCMITLDGMPIQHIVDRVGVGARTVHEWVKRYKERGVRGLYDAEIHGPPTKIKYEKIYKKW